MGSWNALTVEITCASVSDFISQATFLGTKLFNVQYLDDLRVRVCMSGTDYFKITKLASKRGASVRVVEKKGTYFTAISYLNRPVILVGVLLWLFMVLYLPTRILLVQVDGNRYVESARIIEAAEKCGIGFGSSRRYVRSEKVKNLLLSEIDSLQWAGINTYGCVAVISVKERTVPLEAARQTKMRSIVASRDGVISELTVTKGNPVCKVGQAVRAGQVLVSGYTDCGLTVRVERAEAEIKALTNRTLTAATLTSGTHRTNLNKIDVRYSIQIGKNIVKLYKYSGITDPGCVKIYSRKQLTLPGGFALPVSWIQETVFYYNSEDFFLENDDAFSWMEQSAEEYLRGEMIAGRILRGESNGKLSNGAYCLNGIYFCEEMIGKARTEEFEQQNE